MIALFFHFWGVSEGLGFTFLAQELGRWLRLRQVCDSDQALIKSVACLLDGSPVPKDLSAVLGGYISGAKRFISSPNQVALREYSIFKATFFQR